MHLDHTEWLVMLTYAWAVFLRAWCTSVHSYVTSYSTLSSWKSPDFVTCSCRSSYCACKWLSRLCDHRRMFTRTTIVSKHKIGKLHRWLLRIPLSTAYTVCVQMATPILKPNKLISKMLWYHALISPNRFGEPQSMPYSKHSKGTVPGNEIAHEAERRWLAFKTQGS